MSPHLSCLSSSVGRQLTKNIRMSGFNPTSANFFLSLGILSCVVCCLRYNVRTNFWYRQPVKSCSCLYTGMVWSHQGSDNPPWSHWESELCSMDPLLLTTSSSDDWAPVRRCRWTCYSLEQRAWRGESLWGVCSIWIVWGGQKKVSGVHSYLTVRKVLNLECTRTA